MEDLKEPRKIKIDKEKAIFAVCLLVIFIILFKVFYIVVYYLKAQEVFHNKPVCETYKSLYASELHKGEVADIQPILHQAKNEECVKAVDTKDKKEEKVKSKETVKEDRAYDALTIHEVNK